MNGRAVTLSPGTRLFYDGDLVEVVEFGGTQVVVRNDRTAGFVTVKLNRLVALARPADPGPAAGDLPPLAAAWSGLTDALWGARSMPGL